MNLVAMLYLALSLLGLDVAGSQFVHHDRVDGVEVLHSRAAAHGGIARFECLASRSGQCHYRVSAGTCVVWPPREGGCTRPPVRRFTLAAGERLTLAGLHEFDLCVGASAPPHDCARRH